MKVAVYSRVSRDDLHIENQASALKRKVDGEGWDATWFEEKESTRKTRPVREDILKRLRNREFDALLVYSVDRWSRSVAEFALELDEFKARRIGFYSLREAFSYDQAMGTAMMQMAAIFAQLERDLLRERTISGLNRVKAQGKRLGRPKGSLGVRKRKIATQVVRDYLAGKDVGKVGGLIDDKVGGLKNGA